MPITKGRSNKMHMPRVAKIHLGIKVQGQGNSEYPKQTDYFVWPKEEEYKELKEKLIELYGEKPTVLPIMFPTNDIEQFAPQFYRSYSRSWGLICEGTGEIITRRRIDTGTGEIANRNTNNFVWVGDNYGTPLVCSPGNCELFLKKYCRPIMNLFFFLPKAPGLGVFQIDTSSEIAMSNINSMVFFLQGTVGRCNMIPLNLRYGPTEVAPSGVKRKKVNVLFLESDKTLEGIALQAQIPAQDVILKLPTPSDAPDGIPEDLFPGSVLEAEESYTDSTGEDTGDKPEPQPKGEKKGKPKKEEEPPDLPPDEPENINTKSKKLIYLLTDKEEGMGMESPDARNWLKTKFGKEKIPELTEKQIETAISDAQAIIAAAKEIKAGEDTGSIDLP